MNITWNYPRHAPLYQIGEDSEYIISGSHFPECGHSVGAIAHRKLGGRSWQISEAVPSHKGDSSAWRAYAAGCVEAVEVAGESSSVVLFIRQKAMVDYLDRALKAGCAVPPPRLGKKPKPVEAHEILLRFFEAISGRRLSVTVKHFDPKTLEEKEIDSRLHAARHDAKATIPKAA